MTFILSKAASDSTYARNIAKTGNGIIPFREVDSTVPRNHLGSLTITDKIRDDLGLSKIRFVFDVPSSATDVNGVPLGSIKADATVFIPSFITQQERADFAAQFKTVWHLFAVAGIEEMNFDFAYTI